MALSRSRRDSGMNYWPGFVDALSTLILCVIFLLTVFMVAQFFLSQEVAGKDTALARLNAQISRLSQLLSLEQTGKANLEDQVAQLRASLTAAEGERDRLRGAAGASPNPAPGPGEGDNAKIDLEKEATARAVAQIENLNQQISALRKQIGRARRCTRRLRAEGQGLAAAHRRSGPAAQRGAGAAGAGIVALSLGLFRQAARHPRQPARHPRRRRPLRIPIRSVLRIPGKRRCGPKAAPSSISWPPRCSISKSRSRPRSTGCCASTGIPIRASSARPRRSSRTGNCRRRAPSRWCNI